MLCAIFDGFLVFVLFSFLLWKTNIRCAIRSITQRKHAGIVMRSLYTTEITFMHLPSPLGDYIFLWCSFLSFHLKPTYFSAKVIRRSGRGCATHRYWSGGHERGPAPAALVVLQLTNNALGLGHLEICEPNLTIWHHRHICMICSGENTTQKWATNSQFPPKQCTLYHAPSKGREVVQSQNHSCVCSLCGHSNWLHL